MPTRNISEKCPTCGLTTFNPACPDCRELEETLRHYQQGVEGYDK